jgi:hypothetical protein
LLHHAMASPGRKAAAEKVARTDPDRADNLLRGVQGLWFRVLGLGFMVWSLESSKSSVWTFGLGRGIQNLGCRIQGPRFRV